LAERRLSLTIPLEKRCRRIHILADLQKWRQLWDEELLVPQSAVALVSAFATELTEQHHPFNRVAG